MTKLYYYPYTPHPGEVRIEEHPLFELLYPLEQYHPPHKDWLHYPTNACPSMKAFENQSFVVRSPIDISLQYDSISKKWSTDASEKMRRLITINDNTSDVLQLGFYYLFWQDKKSDTQLFFYDPPLYALESLPNFYITAGMIPVGKYTRNISFGLQIKDNTKPIKIKRGQPIATITVLSSHKVDLIRKEPSQKILDTNHRNLLMKHFCPYTASRKLFSNWL